MVPQEKAASDEGAKDQNADAVEPVEEPPRVAPKEEPREENFTFVGVVDPIVVQVDDSDAAEDIPARRRARSSSRNSAVSSSNMSSSPEIIQRSPTLKRKTGSSASHGIEAKRRAACDQASRVTPVLGRTKTPASAEVPASAEDPASAEVPASTEVPASAEVPASTEFPASVDVPASVEVPTSVGVPASAEVPNFPRDNRVNGDEVEKANCIDEQRVTSTPTPARKIDPRVLQLKQLQVLLVRGSVFKCTICGRILVKSTLSDANRHCLREHSVNIVQYFKMASAMSDGELSIINIPVLFHSDSSVVMLLNCHFISQDLGSTPACSSANSAGILTQHLPPNSSITFPELTGHPGKSTR